MAKLIDRISVRDYLPLQQGLRLLFHSFISLNLMCVKDYLPLQQGLRPQNMVYPTFHSGGVRDYLPLQQGLRPIFSSPTITARSQRLSSITTRIKTKGSPTIELLRCCQRLSSITTRIKTSGFLCKRTLFWPSETIFHYNKD